MTVTNLIHSKLTQSLAPTRLIIVDDSARHIGHGGHHTDGESHFQITVVSATFEGKPMLARHRMVYQLLAEEMASRVHALCLRTLTPTEDI